MTKAQRRKVLHEAAEAVEIDRHGFACHAIEFGDTSVADRSSRDELSAEFSAFYQRHAGRSWACDAGIPYPQSQDWRVILLLWFCEVGMEGIGEG